MVREVIHIQVGQCGNQVGTKFWETIAQEHGLTDDGSYAGNEDVQLEKIDVYYQEASNSTYVPRAVLVDMERSVLNHIQQRTYGKMFRPENILTSTEGAANNFMEGCYSEQAKELCDRSVETIRNEVERCDVVQGFSFSHSSAGGTGSGLTMRIESIAAEMLTDTMACSWFFTVFPSHKISNVVLEPYNTMLCLEKQTVCENIVCFDNEALYRICTDTLGVSSPTFGDMNRVVSMVMSGNTASFRFPGQVNTDMNKLSYSLRARSFLRWYIPSFAPLTSLKSQRYRKITVSELVRQMNAEENQLFDCQPDARDEKESEEDINGRCFAYAALFRGEMCTQDVDEALTFLRGDQTLENNLRSTIGYSERRNYVLESVKTCQLYKTFNPRPTFNSITNYAAPGLPMSCTYLKNSSQVKHKFIKYLRQATRMYSTNSYLWWYDPSKYEAAGDSFTGLEDMLTKMSQEWIAEFGVEDDTTWPEPLDTDQVLERMIE